jgi:hypothetical protein
MNYGHYYIYIRKEEVLNNNQESKWYLLNDSYVNIVNWSYVIKDSYGCKNESETCGGEGCSAYVLKYVRVDYEKEILGEYDKDGKPMINKSSFQINTLPNSTFFNNSTTCATVCSSSSSSCFYSSDINTNTANIISPSSIFSSVSSISSKCCCKCQKLFFKDSEKIIYGKECIFCEECSEESIEKNNGGTPLMENSEVFSSKFMENTILNNNQENIMHFSTSSSSSSFSSSQIQKFNINNENLNENTSSFTSLFKNNSKPNKKTKYIQTKLVFKNKQDDLEKLQEKNQFSFYVYNIFYFFILETMTMIISTWKKKIFKTL